MWGQKVPPKCKSGGKKRRQNSKVTAKSATTQISEKKVMVAECAIKMEKWWRKTPLKQQSDGKKCHHFTTLVELQPPHIIYRVQELLPRRKIMETLMAFIFFGKRSDLFRILQNQ
ncbi:hypothetical protein [Gallintestinimicrobium sp.]|uniref:hypothetical protein n=1 Tax=Gallintestinimicrobium sp. TaxID=2981655 RepID=UPI003078C7E0